MATKVKNPLSVFFGQTLQAFRKKEGVRAEDVSSILEIAPSAYRMIESGYANLNPSRVLSLLSIPCFLQIVYEKVSTLLISIQVLEPLRNSPAQLAKAFEQLMSADKELAITLKIETTNFKELFENETKLEAYFEDLEIIENFKSYLIYVDNLNFESISRELKEIIANTPCILIPFVDAQVKQLKSQLDIIKSISKIKDQVNESYKRIRALNTYELGLLEPNAVTWRNSHKFKSTIGIFKHYKNLDDQYILDKFKDNLRQLWYSDFTQLGYILLCERNELASIKKVLKTFKKHIMDLFKNEIEQPFEKIDFKEGFDKIKIGVISPSEKIIKEIGIDLKGNDELWFYEDTEKYKYAIETIFTGSLQYSNETGKYSDIEVLQFKYQKGEDMEKSFKLLDKVWEKVEIISI